MALAPPRPADVASRAAPVPRRDGRGLGGVPVAFRVPAELGATHAELVGEFVSWVPLPMDRAADGSHHLVVHLDPGHRWRYRFVLDGELIVNDPAADDYVDAGAGGAISVVQT